MSIKASLYHAIASIFPATTRELSAFQGVDKTPAPSEHRNKKQARKKTKAQRTARRQNRGK